MPRIVDDDLQFIYLCDPTRLIDAEARTIAEAVPPIVAQQFRGGSQAIAFDDGWLALVHEARVKGKEETRYYRHRCVLFDDAGKLQTRRDLYNLDSRVLAAIKEARAIANPALESKSEPTIATPASAARAHRRKAAPINQVRS